MLFSSYDAINILAFTIQNKTDEVISIHNPNYSLNMFELKVDSVIHISPDETCLIGRSKTTLISPRQPKTYKEIILEFADWN